MGAIPQHALIRRESLPEQMPLPCMPPLAIKPGAPCLASYLTTSCLMLKLSAFWGEGKGPQDSLRVCSAPDDDLRDRRLLLQRVSRRQNQPQPEKKILGRPLLQQMQRLMTVMQQPKRRE
jgi:hypothetical protein